MLGLLRKLNREIGKGYDERAALLWPILENEGIRFGEDGVKLTEKWRAFLAFAWRQYDASVRVTTHAIYIFRYRNNLGERMAQPILAFPLPGQSLASQTSLYVLSGMIETIEYEATDAILRGRLRSQRFTLRLSLQNVRAFASAVRSG